MKSMKEEHQDFFGLFSMNSPSSMVKNYTRSNARKPRLA